MQRCSLSPEGFYLPEEDAGASRHLRLFEKLDLAGRLVLDACRRVDYFCFTGSLTGRDADPDNWNFWHTRISRFVARLIGDDRQADFLMLFLLSLGLILLFVFPVEGRRAAEASIMLLDGALALLILGVAYISLQGVTYGLALASGFLLLGTVKVASGRG